MVKIGIQKIIEAVIGLEGLAFPSHLSRPLTSLRQIWQRRSTIICLTLPGCERRRQPIGGKADYQLGYWAATFYTKHRLPTRPVRNTARKVIFWKRTKAVIRIIRVSRFRVAAVSSSTRRHPSCRPSGNIDRVAMEWQLQIIVSIIVSHLLLTSCIYMGS